MEMRCLKLMQEESACDHLLVRTRRDSAHCFPYLDNIVNNSNNISKSPSSVCSSSSSSSGSSSSSSNKNRRSIDTCGSSNCCKLTRQPPCCPLKQECRPNSLSLSSSSSSTAILCSEETAPRILEMNDSVVDEGSHPNDECIKIVIFNGNDNATSASAGCNRLHRQLNQMGQKHLQRTNLSSSCSNCCGLQHQQQCRGPPVVQHTSSTISSTTHEPTCSVYLANLNAAGKRAGCGSRTLGKSSCESNCRQTGATGYRTCPAKLAIELKQQAMAKSSSGISVEADSCISVADKRAVRNCLHGRKASMFEQGEFKNQVEDGGGGGGGGGGGSSRKDGSGEELEDPELDEDEQLDEEDDEDNDEVVGDSSSIIYQPMKEHRKMANRLNRSRVSRSGSQCSTMSTASSSSSANSTMGSSGSFGVCMSSTALSSETSPNIRKNRASLSPKLSNQDDNNNDSSYPDAYGTTQKKNIPQSTSSAAPVQLPPPPPPPPPPPVSHLLHTDKIVLDLAQVMKQSKLRSVSSGDETSSSGVGGSVHNHGGRLKSSRPYLLGSQQIPNFIPPQFSSPHEDGTNIKPSEYLKRMSSSSALASSSVSGTDVTDTASISTSTSNSNSTGSSNRFSRFNKGSENRFKSASKRRTLGELNRSQSTSALTSIDHPSSADSPQQVGSSINGSSAGSSTTSIPSSVDLPATNEVQRTAEVSSATNLMNSIKNFDRSNFFHRVEPTLKKQEDVTKAGEQLIGAPEDNLIRQPAPVLRSVGMADGLQVSQTVSAAPHTHAKEEVGQKLELLLASTKSDLIAELKESKGLEGIKRMKEECRNKGELEKKVAALVPSFRPDDFLDKVTESEPGAPLWRRQMLAKKAAERARKECQDKMRQDLEALRLSQVPVWKRQMLAKKAAERSKRDDIDKVKRDAEERRLSEMPAWKRQLAIIKMNGASTGGVNEVEAPLP